MDDRPDSRDETQEAQALIAEAASLAAPNCPADFVTKLFARTIPDDLLRCRAANLAALARDAWDFAAVRRVGAPKIRIVDLAGAADASVLEILNDDMPFLVDSVMAELSRQGIESGLLAHPVITVERNPNGERIAYGEKAVGPTGRRESLIHVHIADASDEAHRVAIVEGLERMLADVRVAVSDWQEMLRRIRNVVADLKASPPPLPVDEIAEAIQFLEWLLADNFTFLGARDYVYTSPTEMLEPDFESGLGILRSRDMRILKRGGNLVSVTPEISRFLKTTTPLIVRKAALRSRVHRNAYLDYIGVKRFDPNGALTGEFRIVGLFTSTAYTRSPPSIPYLRRKIANVVALAGFDPRGHDGKALANVLDNYPRDELFQIDEETLYRFATAIMQLEGRARVRVLARRDEFDRFVSVLVFLPEADYSSDKVRSIGRYLATVYEGRVSATYQSFPEGPNVRIHYIIGRDEGRTPDPDRATLEHAVEEIVRSWIDRFGSVLHETLGREKAAALLQRYREVFPASYRGVYSPQTAVADLRILDKLSGAAPRGVDFYRPAEGPAIGLKIWSRGRPIALSERVPILENMGFRVVDEQTFDLSAPAGETDAIWFHDMTLECVGDEMPDLAKVEASLEACFLAVMDNAAENDGYNALVLLAGLGWRDVALLRAISRYLRQVLIPYSQDYMWATLRKHPAIAQKLVELFYARFDPRIERAERERREADIAAAIETALGGVDVLDEDRILRRFVNAVQSGLRTNYFQLGADGKAAPVIAIKFDSRKLEGLPLPRPLYEITVYSPRIEGIHLRFGKVARGGIRWSDRPQDFRTEILGLVKAQQVKNAVIVPVGAKGGFVPKFLPVGGSRDAIQEEGVAAYRLFIQSMLDMTDNVGADGIMPPVDVVRHDGDDPYLVVAADKGTATFSDIANGIAQEHGFWLDDAFASGGSAGYDHKKMGITARGAWESVKRHFREMNVDIGVTPFTTVGVGDMSGDVFGNGMLREHTAKLIAAFDHRDIFIDPDPDPEKTFAERKRLFDLPRSSWQDYDKTLLSKGGGVYSRSLKQIDLSAEARDVLGLKEARVTPQDLMRAILKAQVDLLFFGGIGTYVRAGGEADAAVGDRANDAIRVVGAALRCKVVGEGANLGMTQLGRVEAGKRGVRLNTDAIDNSAGVNTSDVEVNIKIATAIPMREGRLTREARNDLLAAMTDDVAHLVLRNNYQQTLSLSLTQSRALDDFGFQQRMMQLLEARGLLDRAVEFLPDDMALAERRRRSEPLTRPELSVLLAYAKLTLKAELIESEVPDDPYLAREISRYFPLLLAERFPDALMQHRLRREIIAMQLSNSIVNRGGSTFLVRIADQTGAPAPRIAEAFAAVRDSYSMTAFNTDIELLDNQIASELQLELFTEVQDLLLDRVVWFLRNVDFSAGLAALVDQFRDGVAAVDAASGDALPQEFRETRQARLKELIEAGVPQDLAARVANLPMLTSAPDIVLVAARAKRPVADVTATFFAVSSYFSVEPILRAARQIPATDYFDRLALDRSFDSIGDALRRITASIVSGGATGEAGVESWASSRSGQVERIRSSIHEIAATGLTLSKLAIAASLLGDLAGA